MVGIDNLLKLVTELGRGGTILHEIFEDGKISLRDVGELRDIFKFIKGMTGIDLEALRSEAKDLDDTEKDALANTFASALKVGGGSLEETIETGFATAFEILETIAKLIAWGKKKAS